MYWTVLSASETFISYVRVSVDSNVELGEVSDCENIDNLDEKFQRLRFTKKGAVYNTTGASVVSLAV